MAKIGRLIESNKLDNKSIALPVPTLRPEQVSRIRAGDDFAFGRDRLEGIEKHIRDGLASLSIAGEAA